MSVIEIFHQLTKMPTLKCQRGNMVRVIEILAVLVVLVLCARFRVNLWSLLPWAPMAPKRYDDEIKTLLTDERDKPK